MNLKDSAYLMICLCPQSCDDDGSQTLETASLLAFGTSPIHGEEAEGGLINRPTYLLVDCNASFHVLCMQPSADLSNPADPSNRRMLTLRPFVELIAARSKCRHLVVKTTI